MEKTYKCYAQVMDIINGDANTYTKLQQLNALIPTIHGKPGSCDAMNEIEAFASLTTRHYRISPTVWTYLKQCLIHPMVYDTAYHDYAVRDRKTHTQRRERDYPLDYQIRHDRSGQYAYERETPSTLQRWERFIAKRYAEIQHPPNRTYFRGGVFQSELYSLWRNAMDYTSRKNLWRRTHAQHCALNEAIARTDLCVAEYRLSIPAQYGLPAIYTGHELSLERFQASISQCLKSEQAAIRQGMEHCAAKWYTTYRDLLITADVSTVESETSAPYTVRSVTFHKRGCQPVTYRTEYWLDAEALPRVIEDVSAVIDARKLRNGQHDNNEHEKSAVIEKLKTLPGQTWSGLPPMEAAVSDMSRWFKYDVWRCVERHLSSSLTGFRGQWLVKLIHNTIGIDPISVPDDLRDVQLSPHFNVILERMVGSFAFYRREFGGQTYDYCIKRTSDGMTFHAASYGACIRGLREKTEAKAKQTTPIKPRGIYTAQDIMTKYRFCRTGIESFCSVNGLDVSGAYTKKQLKAAIAPNRAENIARFGRELEKVGLV